ncbi:hypothetical protein GCM10010207_71680 [Streptomyces atratus]|nr:hypothetical protein GCM10010207_71680 [Streptomyces atratus]
MAADRNGTPRAGLRPGLRQWVTGFGRTSLPAAARPTAPGHGQRPPRRPGAVFISHVTVRLTSESETIPTSLP